MPSRGVISNIENIGEKEGMNKLLVKSAETGATLLACVSSRNDDELITYSRNWVKENGYSLDKIIIDIIKLDNFGKQRYDSNIRSKDNI